MLYITRGYATPEGINCVFVVSCFSNACVRSQDRKIRAKFKLLHFLYAVMEHKLASNTFNFRQKICTNFCPTWLD